MRKVSCEFPGFNSESEPHTPGAGRLLMLSESSMTRVPSELNPPSTRRRRSLGARLERHTLWILLGLAGGACAGVLSLEPQIVSQLHRAVPSWSARVPNAGNPTGMAAALAPSSAATAAAATPAKVELAANSAARP